MICGRPDEALIGVPVTAGRATIQAEATTMTAVLAKSDSQGPAPEASARSALPGGASGHQLRLVIEAAPDAMIAVDREGVVVMVNSQVERLFGYGRTELLGRHCERLLPPRLRAAAGSLLQQFFAQVDTADPRAAHELHALRKDGSEFPAELGLNLLKTRQGAFLLASVIDISERKFNQAMEEAAQANLLRQSILDTMPFTVVATDTNGVIVAVNPAAERLLASPREDLLGCSALSMYDTRELRRRAAELSHVHGQEFPADFRAVVAPGARGVVDEREWTFVGRNSQRTPVNLAVATLRDGAGATSGFLLVAYDISQRKRAEAFMRHLAHHDALTGLPNRTLLVDRLEMAIRQARRRQTQLAVLMVDVDHFKRINDTLGHPIGDKLLLTVSQRIRKCIRAVDTVARISGDEFMLLLGGVHSREEIAPVLAEIGKAVAEPVQVNGHELMVSASIGACLFPEDGADSTTLIKNADTALYRAKAAGRKNAQWFTRSMVDQVAERLSLGSDLRRALEQRDLAVHYQPEISLEHGGIIGMEALARWRVGDRFIEPERFISIAEETGQFLALGAWVLATACHDCARLRRELGAPLRLAVNVSARQFQQRSLVSQVTLALEQSGLPAEALELEVTEGALMRDPQESAAVLNDLRSLGVKVVIDDFGTGYSSLSHLTRMPIDKIKIDRSFVQQLAAEGANAAIINAIIAMAHCLDIKVVAEGVETAEQRDYLRARQCDGAQGYLYSHALPVEQFVELFHAMKDLERGQLNAG